MARPLRIEFPGALCHVTSRGNARQRVFRDDEDREMFLATLPGWWSAQLALSRLLPDGQPHPFRTRRPLRSSWPEQRNPSATGLSCYRGEGNVIRIISTRKATAQESRNYP